MNLISFIVDDDLDFDLSKLGDESLFSRVKIADFLSRHSFAISTTTSLEGSHPALIAGIILSEKNRVKQDAVFNHCGLIFPHFVPSTIVDRDADVSVVASWMMQSAISLSRLIADQASMAERENAQIRILYQKLQAALFEVESFDNKPYRSRIVLQILPGGQELKISNVPLVASTKQEYASLHAIDVFLEKKPNVVGIAELLVELAGAQSGRLLAKWAVPESKLYEGWNRFYCPLNDEPIGEAVTLSISATGGITQFALRLGDDQSGSNELAMSPKYHAGIALRLWSGVVGVTLPRGKPGHFVDGNEHVSPTTLFRSELLQLGSAADKENLSLVSWQQDRGGLLVHPKGTKPVIANVKMLPAADLSTVRVHCRLAHSEASVTDFTVWVARSDNETYLTDNFAPQEKNGVSRFLGGNRKLTTQASGMPSKLTWLTLAGGQEGEVSFTVDPPYTGSFDLYLATRNHSKASHYSWAVFTDIQFEVYTS